MRVRLQLAEIAEEMIKTLAMRRSRIVEAAQPPLADRRGVVTCLLQSVAKGHRTLPPVENFP